MATIDYSKEDTQYPDWNDNLTDQLLILDVGDSFPLDRRTVIDSLDNLVDVIPRGKRYRGLRVFVLEDQKEYWFKTGVSADDLIPYHPETAFVVYASETISSIDDASDQLGTVEQGAEATFFDSNNVPTKFVYDGTSWVRFSGTEGSGTVSGTIKSSDITDASSDPESDNYLENVCITKRLPKLLFS